jgi:redox-sensitive bicupin YhaK (pirin superfamily)
MHSTLKPEAPLAAASLPLAPAPADASASSRRPIAHRTRGRRHGPITRLMSPSDLGQRVKPFVFLDLFDVDLRGMDMPLHPHSGIATVTVITRGDVRFDDPDAGAGTLAYGGVEWSRAGGGMWHGKELAAGESERFTGFQLWIALPPELETGAAESQYFPASRLNRAGPATVVLGAYQGQDSPVNAPDGMTYLLVTLRPGETWTYDLPEGHDSAWLALAEGGLDAGDRLSAGEMVVFGNGEGGVRLTATGDADAVFVIGSALPHPYPLHLGNYSVHTSAETLAIGEARIAELGRKMAAAGDRQTKTGSTPVYR